MRLRCPVTGEARPLGDGRAPPGWGCRLRQVPQLVGVAAAAVQLHRVVVRGGGVGVVDAAGLSGAEAGLAGLAFPTSPPGSLTSTPLITKIMQGLSSIASLFAHGNGITGKATGHNEATDGTQPKVRVNPANQDNNSPQPAAAGAGAS